jgi:hypothetical protein
MNRHSAFSEQLIVTMSDLPQKVQQRDTISSFTIAAKLSD